MSDDDLYMGNLLTAKDLLPLITDVVGNLIPERDSTMLKSCFAAWADSSEVGTREPKPPMVRVLVDKVSVTEMVDVIEFAFALGVYRERQGCLPASPDQIPQHKSEEIQKGEK